MEFLSRGGDRRVSQPLNTASSSAHPPAHGGRRKHIDWAARTVRIELFILLLGSALLLGALSLYLGFSSTNTEFDRVDKGKYQAVFLNGGATSGSVLYSTYFGHIAKMNDKYVVLRDVYYLTTDQSSQNNQNANNPQLTKLGCQQLHSPYDEMVVNRSQVAFWENLKDDGKVSQAIADYVKQNPNGPDCSNQTNQAQPTTGTQNSGGNNSQNNQNNSQNGSNP